MGSLAESLAPIHVGARASQLTGITSMTYDAVYFIRFLNADWDSHGAFRTDGTTGGSWGSNGTKFVAPFTGYYDVSASCYITSVGGGWSGTTYAYIHIYKNNVRHSTGTLFQQDATATGERWRVFAVSDKIFMNQGDEIMIAAHSLLAGTRLTNTTYTSFFSVSYTGKQK